MTTTNPTEVPTESPTGRRRGPSMADVAREASVSGQTVSRVSNGRNNVDAETRERVLAAMRKLGYRPNSAARALRTGRFHSIGVIMFTLSSYGNMRTLDAIASAATDAGYSITLIPVPHPTQGEVSVAFERLSEEAVDGVIIIVEAHLLDESDVALPPDLPVVVVDSARARPPHRRHRPGARRHARDRAPARARPPHGVARRRTRALLLRRAPSCVVGVDAARPRRRGATRARRRLVERVGPRARAPARPRPRGHRGVRGERPDGARRAPRAARGAAARCPPR